MLRVPGAPPSSDPNTRPGRLGGAEMEAEGRRQGPRGERTEGREDVSTPSRLDPGEVTPLLPSPRALGAPPGRWSRDRRTGGADVDRSGRRPYAARGPRPPVASPRPLYTRPGLAGAGTRTGGRRGRGTNRRSIHGWDGNPRILRGRRGGSQSGAKVG